MISAATQFAAGGPVIPNFGHGDPCVVRNGQFCTKWFFDNFGSRFEPRLVEHIELTAIAVGVGTVIAVVAAIIAYRYRWRCTRYWPACGSPPLPRSA